jgi:hypothetical protein
MDSIRYEIRSIALKMASLGGRCCWWLWLNWRRWRSWLLRILVSLKLSIRLHHCLLAERSFWFIFRLVRCVNKIIMTSNSTKCVCLCATKYLKMRNLKDKIFVDEVEALWREKPLRGSQTLEIHYPKNKASYKTRVLTYPYAEVIPLTLTQGLSWTLPNQIFHLKGFLMDSFTLGPTLKIDFTRTVEHTPATAWELADLRFSLNTLSKPYGIHYWILYNLQA